VHDLAKPPEMRSPPASISNAETRGRRCTAPAQCSFSLNRNNFETSRSSMYSISDGAAVGSQNGHVRLLFRKLSLNDLLHTIKIPMQ
jgi:hypothetical protein